MYDLSTDTAVGALKGERMVAVCYSHGAGEDRIAFAKFDGTVRPPFPHPRPSVSAPACAAQAQLRPTPRVQETRVVRGHSRPCHDAWMLQVAVCGGPEEEDDLPWEDPEKTLTEFGAKVYSVA